MPDIIIRSGGFLVWVQIEIVFSVDTEPKHMGSVSAMRLKTPWGGACKSSLLFSEGGGTFE